MSVSARAFFTTPISPSTKEFPKTAKIMMRMYNAMNASNEAFGNGAGKMFFLSMVILYNGELHIFRNCKRKELLVLFVFPPAWWHSLAKMEKSIDGCLSPLLLDIFKFPKDAG